MILRPGSLLSASSGALNVLEASQAVGLTPAVALDAGSAASYSSGQTWFDLTSSDRDFHRGSGSGASTDDPTFVGSAGSPVSYWSFDGGDFFTKASANDAFFNGLHKDNAAWSVVLWAADLNVVSSSGLFATRGGTTGNLSQHGTSFVVKADGGLALYIANGSGSSLGLSQGGNAGEVPSSGAVMVACSFDESVGADGGLFYLSTGYTETFTSTVTSPSSSDASNTASIFATAANNPMPSGSKLYGAAMFSSALTAGDFDALLAVTRSRLGI